MTTLTMPYTFTPDTTILSGEVNGNFSAIVSWSTNITDANIKALAAINPNKLNLALSFPVLRLTGLTCFSAGNTGDANPRWLVNSDGFMQMGPGGATAADVTIKRKAASTISVRNAADTAYGSVDAATHSSFAAASDANPTVQMSTTGMKFGAGGASALDVLLKRAAASTLSFRNVGDSAYGTAQAETFNSFADASHANPTVQVTSTGVNWGLGGVSAVDTNLVRSSTGLQVKKGAAFADFYAASFFAYTGAATNVEVSTAGIILSNGVDQLIANGGALTLTGSATTSNVVAAGKVTAAGAGSSFLTAATTANGNAIARFNSTGATGGVISAGKIFVSADQTITAAGSLTLAHGLGYQPLFIQAYLVNVTNSNNYVTGEIVVVQMGAESTATVDSRGVSVVPDATNLNIRFGSAAATFNVLDKTTGAVAAITNGNWSIRFIAF